MSKTHDPTRSDGLCESRAHFFLMALIIFAVYGLNNRTQTVLLELDQADIDGRLFMQEMATGQALSEEQREYFTAAFVEEQILVQEALKMGLMMMPDSRHPCPENAPCAERRYHSAQ